MNGRRRVVGALLGSVALVALTACGGTGTRGSTGGYVSPDGKITTVDPGQRKDAPVLSGDDLDGKALSSADFEGRVMVVNVWGSWCAPCRKEAPVLRQVSSSRDDVQFVGLLARDRPASALAFNRAQGITYPTIVDEGGKQVAKFGSILPAIGIPTTWIVDRSGRVAVRIATEKLTADTLDSLIDYTEKSRP